SCSGLSLCSLWVASPRSKPARTLAPLSCSGNLSDSADSTLEVAHVRFVASLSRRGHRRGWLGRLLLLLRRHRGRPLEGSAGTLPGRLRAPLSGGVRGV